MDKATLKQIITASRAIEKIDQEIKDISGLADVIAAGDFFKISITLSISKPKKEGIVDHDEPIIALTPVSLPEWLKQLQEGSDVQKPADSQSYSRDITDTMALMMIGNVVSELNERRQHQIDRLQQLGITLK